MRGPALYILIPSHILNYDLLLFYQHYTEVLAVCEPYAWNININAYIL